MALMDSGVKTDFHGHAAQRGRVHLHGAADRAGPAPGRRLQRSQFHAAAAGAAGQPALGPEHGPQRGDRPIPEIGRMFQPAARQGTALRAFPADQIGRGRGIHPDRVGEGRQRTRETVGAAGGCAGAPITGASQSQGRRPGGAAQAPTSGRTGIQETGGRPGRGLGQLKPAQPAWQGSSRHAGCAGVAPAQNPTLFSVVPAVHSQ